MENTELNFEFKNVDVEVGKVYPIYGYISNILDSSSDDIILQINDNITLNVKLTDSCTVELLKSRVFEPGIFMTKILNNKDKIIGDCSVIIFGKSNKMVQ
jgi:predicted amino acid racemase